MPDGTVVRWYGDKWQMKFKTIILILAAGVILMFAAGCEDDDPHGLTPSKSRPTGNREYGEIKPVMLTLPDGAIKSLAGTDVSGEPIKEVAVYFRSMTLVVYRLGFDVDDYIERISKTFAALTLVKEFIDEADVWAIQMQHHKTGQFVTISCSPGHAVNFIKSRNLERFLKEIDYLMINDVIISDPDERYEYYAGRLAPPPLQTDPPTP